MVKVILFDFWGTLVENGVRSPIKQVKYILGINVPFSEYVVRMERAMMTEEFSELKDAFKSVCEEFSIPVKEEKLAELVGMWNKSWMLAEEYREVKEVLKELRKKYKVVLISNTDNISVNNVLDKFELRECFEKLFLSYEMGLIKTDKLFLKKVVDDLNVAIEDCVVVGDSIQSDIMAARRLGIRAVLVDRRKTRDYPKKVINLKELPPLLEKL